MSGERLSRALHLRQALGSFFERSWAPVMVVEPEGGLATANDAALAQYGYSLEELVELRIHDLMAEPRPGLAAELERAFQGNAVPMERRPHRRKDGSVMWVAPVAGPQTVQGERLIVSVAHDVSALVGAEEIMAARLASLGRLTAGVAHEVNNPAAFVTLALPLIKDRVLQGKASEALALLDDVMVATGQITEVMRDLGGVARDRPRSVVDLASLASGALRMASYESDTRPPLSAALEDGLRVDVRATRVAQALLNLVLNATQAIAGAPAEGARIDVRVRRAGDCALMEVADTGPGVPDSLAARIFEPFFTTRSALGGTGLGLWLSRNIIEEEGGTLTWRNRPEGGAVFTVSLPLSRTEGSRAEISAE